MNRLGLAARFALTGVIIATGLVLLAWLMRHHGPFVGAGAAGLAVLVVAWATEPRNGRLR